ncbi:hypothetical protein SPFM12_00231 [Salmonella phage SPFM12]|nr:hypothetical protein SPFM12_00231 [Salmonella phage SPFM12]
MIDEITKFYRRVLLTQFNTWLFPDWDCPDWWWDKPVLPPRNLDLWPLHLYPKAAKVLIDNREVHVEKAYYLTESAIHDWNGQIIEPRFYHWENGVFSLRHCRTIDPTGQTGIIRMELFEVCSIDDLPYVWNAEVVPYIELLHVFGTDVAFGEENMTDPEPYLLSPTEQFERTHSPLKAKQQKNLDGTWWINESRQFLRLWWPEIDPPFVSNEEGVQRHQPEEVVITYPYIINQTPLPDDWDNDENHYETSFVIRFSYQRLAVRYAPTRIETVYDVISPTKAHFTPDVFTTGNVAGGQNVECYIAAGTRVPKYDDFKDYLTMTESEAYYLIPKPALKLLNDELLRWANRLDSLIDMGRYSAPVRVMYNVTITLRRVGPSRQVGLAAEIPFFHNPEDQVRAPNRVYVEVEEERDERARINRNTAHQPGSTLGDETPVDYSAERVLNESGIERASVVFTDSLYFEIPSLDKTMRKAVVDGVVLFFCVLGQ